MKCFSDKNAYSFRKSVCVVVPTYNESENLPELTERIFSLNLPRLSVLIVDDNSPDRTAETARRLSLQYKGAIQVLQRRMKSGLGTAYIEGFQSASAKGYEIIVQMDADLSHRPEYLPQMIDFLQEYDVVVGSRYIDKNGMDSEWGIHRKILSFCGNLGIRWVSGIQAKDVTSGFKVFRTRILKEIDWTKIRSSGFGFQAEVAFQCEKNGVKILEYPIVFDERTRGKSKMSFAIICETVYIILSLRANSLFR
ncbi:MAG: polyprenol monophosphomannose synthase [SAR202 cluster bacterium]|nr:polyprenol monophosphomannose synthase [SAR202 cluster bacterium]